jgi:hypothetical protein
MHWQKWKCAIDLQNWPQRYSWNIVEVALNTIKQTNKHFQTDKKSIWESIIPIQTTLLSYLKLLNAEMTTDRDSNSQYQWW